MRRACKILAWTLTMLAGLPLLLVVFVLVALNTGPGQRLGARLVTQATGGQVVLDGISGRFPDALRVARIEVRDAQGTWLTVQNAALDWSPLRLAYGEARVKRLAAAEVAVARLPVASDGASTSFELPVRLDMAALHVDRLDIAAPVARAQASFAADGSAHLASLRQGSADLALRRLDGDGQYRAKGRLDAATISATLTAEEPAHGLLSGYADLPDIGALSVRGSIDGSRSNAATRVSVSAGPLQASAQGQVDIDGAAADLDVTATAPAMAPRADLSWRSVTLAAHLHGPFDGPEAHGTVQVDGLSAAGASVARLAGRIEGDQGRVALTASAERVRIPGPQPDLLAAAPVTLKADARLDASDRPVSIEVSHPLLSLRGEARTGGEISAHAHLDVPDIAPLAALGGADLQGNAGFEVKLVLVDRVAPALEVDGTLGVTGGMDRVPGVLGPDARIGVSAALHGGGVTVSRLRVDGTALHLAAHGEMTGGVVNLDWQAALPDLSALAPTVQGRAQGQGHVQGRPDNFAAQAELTGDVATRGVPSGPLKLSLAAQGLPDAPTGNMTAEGTLDGAPLALKVGAERLADGGFSFAIDRADWKSAHAEGALALSATRAPSGKLGFRVARLEDFRGLLGQPTTGALDGTLEVGENGRARVQVTAREAGLAGSATVGRASLDASVANPVTDPEISAKLDLAGLNASGVGGAGQLQVSGKPAALAVQARASLQNVAGQDVQASAAARLDVPRQRIAISALQATRLGETLRLLDPATVTFAGGVSVDRLRLGLRGAVLEAAGRVTPTLGLTASLRNVGADIARIFAPELHAEGSVQADATLSGTLARPDGKVRLTGTGLRLRNGPGAAMPATAVTADVTLAGTTAQIQGRATLGGNELRVDGTLPLDPAAAIDIRARGALDLAVLDRLVAAQGQRVRGQVALNATVTGSLAAPRADGGFVLTDGGVEDFALGARVSDIQASLQANGDTLRITRFSGKAGSGTISAGGSVGLAGEMPVDVQISARNATPLASDKLTALLNADLTLRGDLGGKLTVGGTTTLGRTELRIPERMPAKVAVLDVRVPGAPPPSQPAPGPNVGLDVQLTAPGQVFIRGRGVFAELAGRFNVGGTLAAPQATGRFTLRQGDYGLAGHTLTFTSGEIGFDGSGSLDPTLNLVASSTNGGVTATLTITGYASAPKITLSSVPELPQDEVLAQLLFNQSASSLSVFQLAEAAAALAQISGVVGGSFDPLGTVRQGLGLDRLSVGGAQTGNGASLQAGRYVARGVFVGAKQGTSGDTQASVQIDLTKGLKLETTIGTGGTTSVTGATATADPSGTSVGLTYHFEY
jgi:translocation and assembly module TamB